MGHSLPQGCLLTVQVCAPEFPEEPKFSPRSDPELAAVVDAWPTLPDALKAGILAMVTSGAYERPEPEQRAP